MFGFPFFTSLIVVLLGVVALSLIINKGLAKRRQETAEPAVNSTINKTQHSH